MKTRWFVAAGVLVAILLAGIVSIYASGDPDGLTKVSEDHGFAHTEKRRDGLIGDYGSATGVVGVLVVLGIAGGVTYAVRRRGPRDEQS